jgi:DNA-binding CsgD family transcriptional regulator
MRFDPVGVVEAAYAWHERTGPWLEGIARAMRPLESGLGVYARIDDWSNPDVPRVLTGVWDEGPPDWLEAINRMQAAAPREVNRKLYSPGQTLAWARAVAERLPPEMMEGWSRDVGPYMHDCLGLFGHDVDGRCVHVGIPVPRARRFHPRTLHRLARIAAHLTSAVRLRRFVSAPSPGSPDTDAVITPDGRVAHAAGEAQAGIVRERLGRAARSLERARSGLRRRDPDEALATWRGLVDGRWSLVDHWDSDGRRFMLARKNAPQARDPRALTEAEGAVVAFLAMGHAEKYVAYLLGVAASTVASHFASARRKLRVRSRQELITLFSPLGT